MKYWWMGFAAGLLLLSAIAIPAIQYYQSKVGMCEVLLAEIEEKYDNEA